MVSSPILCLLLAKMNIEQKSQTILKLLSLSCFVALININTIHCSNSSTTSLLIEKQESKNRHQTQPDNTLKQPQLNLNLSTQVDTSSFAKLPLNSSQQSTSSYWKQDEQSLNIEQNVKLNNSETSNLFETLPTLTLEPFTASKHLTDQQGECKGRVKLTEPTGILSDGIGLYNPNIQCSWLIDSETNNATIVLRFYEFNIECNYDYVYIFDGDSIYSPLIGAFSGDIKDFSTNPNYQDDNPRKPFKISTSISKFDDDESKTNNSDSKTNIPFEVRTTSGKAFVYFHSDTAQSMRGFLIKYSINDCPLDCLNRGSCDKDTLRCKCRPGYHGDSCQYITCPNNCTSSNNGYCDKKRLKCICSSPYSGVDCSKKTLHSEWKGITEPYFNDMIEPRAFHQAIVVNDIMFIVGGKTKSLMNPNQGSSIKEKTPVILKYDLINQSWLENEKVYGYTNQDHLAELSSHSSIFYGDKIYTFGGLTYNNSISNTLTIFDINTSKIKTILNDVNSSDEDYKAPIAVVGHSANVVGKIMYIFLGYNPYFGFMSIVQKYDLSSNTWSIVNAKGANVRGTIGHSSSYDAATNSVFLFGGHNSEMSNNLHLFDVAQESWTFLQPSMRPRYLHSAIIISNQLFIIGGNSYNTSSKGDQCFEQKNLVFDLACVSNRSKVFQSNVCDRDCWTFLDSNENQLMKRQGFSLTRYNNELILFGGFNGLILNDHYSFNIVPCSSYKTSDDCKKPTFGPKCLWAENEQTCVDILATDDSNKSLLQQYQNTCLKSDHKFLNQICNDRKTCYDCLSTNLGCTWCGSERCQFGKCRISSTSFNEPSSCIMSDEFFDPSYRIPRSKQEFLDAVECRRYETCQLCNEYTKCSWMYWDNYCDYERPHQSSTYRQPDFYPGEPDIVTKKNVTTSNDQPLDSSEMTSNKTALVFNNPFEEKLSSSLIHKASCESPCFNRKSCMECTSTKCIWCSTSEECIDTNAYFAYHNMGQCMHYVAQNLKCSASSCSGLDTCKDCLTNPKCGWLNDKSDTGKGKCIEGDSKGPRVASESKSSTTDLVEYTEAQRDINKQWFFTSCPACQCNGHSHCRHNSSLCIQPCLENTEGHHCDRCVSGFYGDPVNGGVCKPCKCNGHAQTCNREIGKCYCSTKGIIGHECNRCDDQNHYIGDIGTRSSGTCYYNLSTDYQYTFNMSKLEDQYYSEINFINTPFRRDLDVEFSISCSRSALVNITSGFYFDTHRRRELHTGVECSFDRVRFPLEKHLIGDANYSFFVHVHKIHTPFILQISFSQTRAILPTQFFLTFASCFLFFFSLAGLTWKLKHEYNLYMRRQQQFIELEQMANRPFSTFLLELPTELYMSSKQTKSNNKNSISSIEVDKLAQNTSKSNNQSKQHQNEKKLDEVDSASQVASDSRLINEPTPISFEPCSNEQVGIVSLFVQLPGRSNLAIGSALVGLTEASSNKESKCSVSQL